MAARGRLLAWALYDWANSAYATTVIAGFFPLFFSRYWNAGQPALLKLGLAHALTGLAVAVLAPVLGAIADRGGRRRWWLGAFTVVGALATAALALPGYGAWLAPLALLVLAGIGFACACTFYDALLVDVCPPARRDFGSAVGYALGYLGGGLLFAGNLWLYLNARRVGLADEAQAVKLSFLSVAVWWVVFSVPLLLWVREAAAPSASPPLGQAVRAGLAQLRATCRQVRHDRNLLLFLAAFFCYIDGVHSVIEMAVAFAHELGFGAGVLMTALLVTQFVGFPAALVFGRLGERWGARPTVVAGLAAYAVMVIGSCFLRSSAHFYAMAVGVGLVQGAVQALSRSLYARLIPPAQAAEYFGFYNILGKFASIIGPLAVGLTAHFVRLQLSMLALLPLFVVGALLLLRVRLPPPAPAAATAPAA